MAALCMHARGQLDEATCCYDALLSLKPGHQAWYTRECCVYLWSNIRRSWREFSPDAELDPEFKVKTCFSYPWDASMCNDEYSQPDHSTCFSFLNFTPHATTVYPPGDSSISRECGEAARCP